MTLNSSRLHIQIKGIVQGVGFRPCVYRIARQLELSGYIRNDSAGVTIEVQGERADAFITWLNDNLPPLAQIDHIAIKSLPTVTDEREFVIITSKTGKTTTKAAPDSSICQDCLAELFDPTSRFYRYPFINCTHCGPRYSIINDLPYDRGQTSMSQFVMCTACAQAYQDPLDRRYHAQPIACADCGPRLSHPIALLAQALQAGKILAVKGLGGYQLICDARHATAVSLLRKRKAREAKPFAVMALNPASIARFAICSAKEETLLQATTRPIVLLTKDGESLAEAVAPGLNTLGFMLAYTPLHYLLFNQLMGKPAGLDWLSKSSPIVLIVTSANSSGDAIIYDDKVAKAKLSGIADMIVSHNRSIVIAVDDSVMRVIAGAPVFIRRARGFTPYAIPLSTELPPLLALGGQLKNTLCLTRGKEAFVSQHLGDLDNVATLAFFHHTYRHLSHLLDIQPVCVVHDKHPDFYTSRFAEQLGLPSIAVQHHHAHLAAVVAEHGIPSPVLGLILDGYGLGEDNGAWGGELLLYEDTGYQRLGHLAPLLQTGGDKAVKQPWRMAAGALYQLGLTEQIGRRFAQQPGAQDLAMLLEKRTHTLATSSCGRLFDAASALLNVCLVAKYEAEAAMLLESLVTEPQILPQGWILQNHQLSLLPTLSYLLDCDPITGANIFHGTLAAALAAWVKDLAIRLNINRVVVTGGCCLNKILTEGLIMQLQHAGITAILPRKLPPNDGGLSLGQAWIAGRKLMEKGI